MSTVSILVVSYNTRELTLECLRSVFAHTRTDFELIVVDNDSQDGSADAIEAEFGARVRLMRSAENLGFAGGNNLAARQARGEFVLLLNPDTELRSPAIDALVAYARQEPRAGLWGGRTTFADGSLNPGSCWSRPTPWTTLCYSLGLTRSPILKGFFDPERLPTYGRDEAREVDVVSGCFLLLTRALWEELEGFDLRFHMYAEDVDLCLRARVRGARPRVTPTATLVHHGGASERAPAQKTIRLFRAKVQLFDKHWSRSAAGLGRRLLVLGSALRWLACTVLVKARLVRPEAGAKWREVYAKRDEWTRSEAA